MALSDIGDVGDLNGSSDKCGVLFGTGDFNDSSDLSVSKNLINSRNPNDSSDLSDLNNKL